MYKRFYLVFLIVLYLFSMVDIFSQDFMLQGWYWDYPKTKDGNNWADTLISKAHELSNVGYTYVWLPPFERTSSGSGSNGYDPKDLFDLGEFGLGPTQFGTRKDVDSVIAIFKRLGIKAVADVVYNHRDGGVPENNPSVKGWIENYNSDKLNNGDSVYPSDRVQYILPIGGSTGKGLGTYYFKIRSASLNPNFYNKIYKFNASTNKVGWQNLGDTTETEPNGGSDCGQPDNKVILGRNYFSKVDEGGCGIDEFALNIKSTDYNSSGDTIYVTLSDTGGQYADQYIYSLWYDNGATGSNIQNDIEYQTYTNFKKLPSKRGGMDWHNFKPNGSTTHLSGDLDAMYFYYDYDQNVKSTKDTLFAWTKWLWDDVGIRGLRMDAVKHFPASFVGELLNYLHRKKITPGLVVGEYFDSNPFVLINWINDVKSKMNKVTLSSIHPRIFDFALRDALKNASDKFGYDARNIFTSSIADNGGSGFNVVTFVNNHDFRDKGQPIEHDPILAYAYILTNNQLGIPTVYYPDYFYSGLKE